MHTDEINWWREWLAGRTDEQLASMASAELPPYFRDLIGDRKAVSVLDVGCGAFPLLGSRWQDVEVAMTSADCLAAEYLRIARYPWRIDEEDMRSRHGDLQRRVRRLPRGPEYHYR